MAGVDAEVVVVTHLFSPERASLIELLSALAASQWQAPTVCPGWSVKDVALHLLGDDIDCSPSAGMALPKPTRPARRLASRSWWPLDRLHQRWVEATRRVSPGCCASCSP
jgi:uncharacterized protein (TIGR03083 family)